MAKAIARRRRRPNPRRVRRSRSRSIPTIPLAVVAGFTPLIWGAWSEFQRGGMPSLSQHLAGNLAGYSIESRKLYPEALVTGWTPIVIGLVVHKLASALGINRALAASRIPLLRL